MDPLPGQARADLQREPGDPQREEISAADRPAPPRHTGRFDGAPRRDNAGYTAQHASERHWLIRRDARIAASDQVLVSERERAVRDNLFLLAKDDHIAGGARRPITKGNANQSAIGERSAHAAAGNRDIDRVVSICQLLSRAFESIQIAQKELGEDL
jgi:hypothetical protein